MYWEIARAPPLCTESAGLGATARDEGATATGYGLGARGLRARGYVRLGVVSCPRPQYAGTRI